MINHFEKALNDVNFMEKIKNNIFKRAILHSFSEYRKKGKSIFDLPWFCLAKDKKGE